MSTKENPFSGREKAIENLGGHTALYEKHLKKFQTNYASAGETISQMLHSGNRKEAEIQAHSIKGLSATLGLTPLYHASSHLEQVLKKETGSWEPALAEFEEKLLAVVQSA